jgi:hypothetical protein
MKFQVQTDIKNASGSLKWMSGMTTLQVYTTRFQQVLLNQNFEDVIPSTPPSKTTTATTRNSTTTSTQDNKKKKTQEKIKLLLEQVVGNSGALLSSFQESTNILKNMDRNFAALLEKF